MTPLSHTTHTISAAAEQGGNNGEPPIANLPVEVLAANIFSYLGSKDLSHISQVCRGFNVLVRTTWERRAQDLCQTCSRSFAPFGIMPIGPSSSLKEANAFLYRTVRRVKKINDVLPGNLRSQFSAHDLVCKVGPGHMQEFLQKAYDHSLRTIFGELAHVPENASLEEAVRLIKDWLQTAEAGQIEGLDLGHRGLCCLPREIGQLTALRWMSLLRNQLSALPPEIGQLTALQELYLNDNQLVILPPEIGRLTALRWLFLDSNQLASLPPEIGQLTALQRLRLHENQLTALPPEIARLTALLDLGMAHNKLTCLPSEIGRLTALLDLRLYGNQLASLPPEIGQLTALQQLYLFENRLTSLPPEIGQLTALQGLYLDGNQLESLPPEFGRLTALRFLNLNRNPLKSPPEIGQLTALPQLCLWSIPVARDRATEGAAIS